MAAEYRFVRVPPPLAHCCLLAGERVGGRLLRAVADGTELTRVDCELMALGEHVPATATCAAVLSRNAAEGEALRALHRRHAGARLGILEPTSFTGPLAILRGTIDTESTAAAAVLISDRVRANSPAPREFRLTRGDGAEPFSL